jgi:insertion element IS1 protein InsB
MVISESCPAGGSTRDKNHGHTRHGTQHPRCQNGERPWRASAAHRLMASERRAEMANLLRERLSLRGICRALGVRLTWLLPCMGAGLASCPAHCHGRLPARPAPGLLDQLEAEADAMGSLGPKKAHQPWRGLAMDATTRQMLALHVGARSRASAKALGGESPAVSQDHAILHTAPEAVSHGVMPAERHQAITKQARQTNHLERFNNTLRQRLARLVRATVSFSKQGETHLGASKCFICPYNLEKAAALPV